jgi:hypothetical protein
MNLMRPLCLGLLLLSLALPTMPMPPPTARVPQTSLRGRDFRVPGTSCHVSLPERGWEWRMWAGRLGEPETGIYFARPRGRDVYLNANQFFVYPPKYRSTRRTSLEAYVSEKKAWMDFNAQRVVQVSSEEISTPVPGTYRVALRYLTPDSPREVRHYYCYLLPNEIELAVWTHPPSATAIEWNEPPLFRSFVESVVGCGDKRIGARRPARRPLGN